MKMWHWAVLIAVMFAVIYVYTHQTLKGVPVFGSYLSA